MKILLYGLAGLISFAGALAGVMAATGDLNRESLEKLLARPEEAPPAEEEFELPPEDALSALAQALKQREQRLDQRAAELEQRAAELDERAAELRRLENTVEQRITELHALLETSDNELQARRQVTASTLERMDARKAAERLQGLPPEEVVAILRLVRDKDRASILESMDTDDATRILRLLQQAPV